MNILKKKYSLKKYRADGRMVFIHHKRISIQPFLSKKLCWRSHQTIRYSNMGIPPEKYCDGI